MPVSPIQVALLVALLAALGFVWYHEGRGRWRTRLETRFIYGVPWGTLVTVAVVVAFYLLAQGGLRDPAEPVIWPYITWSYFYPTGLLTAGIAHANAAHIVSNLTATLVLAPIAEYAWGHYRPSRDRELEEDEERRRDPERDEDPYGAALEELVPDGGFDRHGWVSVPWVRALVIFPAALLGAALLTAVFSLGPGLGFSGAVFAIAGFAVVTHPLATVVGVVVTAALRTLHQALTTPVVRETIEVGPPMPPAWAGIGFQAHMLGFLLGVLVAVALLRHRRRAPALQRVFFATLLLGLVQALWLLVWTEGTDTFVLYRGVGVTLVVALSLLVAVGVAGSRRPLPRPLSILPWAPTRRQLAAVWLALVLVGLALGVAGVVMEGQAVGLLVGTLVLLAALLAVPAVPPLVPDRWVASPVTRRGAAVAVVAAFTVLVAAPSIPLGLVVVEDAQPDRGVEVDGYTVAYVDNETSGTTPVIDLGDEEFLETEHSGVIVVNEELEMWTIAQREAMLAFEGNATVVVGGPGWRETVEVERTGWEVLGNDTAYAVDLEVDGATTRGFESEPVRANARLDGHAVAVVPTADGFELRVFEDGSVVGETALPDVGETASVGEVEFETREVDGTEGVFASIADSEVQIAQRETYH